MPDYSFRVSDDLGLYSTTRFISKPSHIPKTMGSEFDPCKMLRVSLSVSQYIVGQSASVLTINSIF
jgi:hypothetical protein